MKDWQLIKVSAIKNFEAYKENPYDDYHNKGLTQCF